MSASLALLLPFIEGADRKVLLVADENCSGRDLGLVPRHVQVLSNRIDIVRQANLAGLKAHFNDFDLSIFPPGSLDLICQPMAKEKAVNRHIAEEAALRLSEGGSLILTGDKQSGIKTFARTAGNLLGTEARARKRGTAYIAAIPRQGDGKIAARRQTENPVADDYCRLRPISTIDDRPVLSKPGLFGWQKQDRGSELLAHQFPIFFQRFGRQPASLLDLGCGYGYLSIMAAASGLARIVATDNCAAAIVACAANFDTFRIPGQVLADDTGAEISEQFDAVVCNPPFHQGFAQDWELTDRFLASARRLLKRHGRALFVVNEFVPLEQRARPYFGSITTLSRETGFKVVELA